jgi:hypothetical protein
MTMGEKTRRPAKKQHQYFHHLGAASTHAKVFGSARFILLLTRVGSRHTWASIAAGREAATRCGFCIPHCYVEFIIATSWWALTEPIKHFEEAVIAGIARTAEQGQVPESQHLTASFGRTCRAVNFGF